MPQISGVELAAEIKARAPQTPVVMYHAGEVADTSNLDWVMRKPASIGTIEEILARLITKAESARAGIAPCTEHHAQLSGGGLAPAHRHCTQQRE